MLRHVLVVVGVLLAVGIASGVSIYGSVVGRYEDVIGAPLYSETGTGETVDVLAPVFVYHEFDGKALDSTVDWNLSGVNSGTAAIQAGAGGLVRLTTGAADDDDVELATPLMWVAERGCSAEVRFATNDQAGAAWAFGFADAVAYAADEVAEMSTTAPLGATTDWAGFVWDPDDDPDVVRAWGRKGGTASDVIETGVSCANGVFHVYRVSCSTAGDLEFWIDGVSVGGVSAGVTADTPLCVYIGFINREGSANTLDVDYVRGWQLRE